MAKAPKLPAGSPSWKCPRCKRWAKGEPIARVCLRCRFEDHRAEDPHCTCTDCLLWADGTHPYSPKEHPRVV